MKNNADSALLHKILRIVKIHLILECFSANLLGCLFESFHSLPIAPVRGGGAGVRLTFSCRKSCSTKFSIRPDEKA